jgi:hypothetical protein
MEHGADGLDGALVQFASLRKPRPVVPEGGMDDGIRRGSAAAQAFQIFKVPSMHLGSGGDQRLSASLATSEAEYLMASFNYFLNGGIPDKTCSTRDKYLHKLSFLNSCDMNDSADGY